MTSKSLNNGTRKWRQKDINKRDYDTKSLNRGKSK